MIDDVASELPTMLEFQIGFQIKSKGHLATPADRRNCSQGSIWIGVPSATARQISSISSFVTAMQPSVQSRRRCALPSQPKPLGNPCTMMSPPGSTPRSFVIALPGLWPQRVATEGDSVLLQNLAMVQQNQRAFFLQDEHLVGACIGRESVVGLADCKQNCNYHE